MFTVNIAKLVVAVALTLAVIAGSGVVAEQVELDVTPSAYACNGVLVVVASFLSLVFC